MWALWRMTLQYGVHEKSHSEVVFRGGFILFGAQHMWAFLTLSSPCFYHIDFSSFLAMHWFLASRQAPVLIEHACSSGKWWPVIGWQLLSVKTCLISSKNIEHPIIIVFNKCFSTGTDSLTKHCPSQSRSLFPITLHNFHIVQNFLVRFWGL